MPAILSHLVFLLPHAQLLSIPTWLSSLFTISPGGRHTNDKIENRYILFKDGTYLELVAFVEDIPVGPWRHKPFGPIDWALAPDSSEGDTDSDQETDARPLSTDMGDFESEAIQDRLAATRTGFAYRDFVSGRGTYSSGEEMGWSDTVPVGIERGLLPFWHYNFTRGYETVPFVASEDVGTATTHPCGAVGFAGVNVLVRDADLRARVEAALEAVLGDRRLRGPFKDGRDARRGWEVGELAGGRDSGEGGVEITVKILRDSPLLGESRTLRVTDMDSVTASFVFV